jgi:hypothetical protein
MLNAIFEAVCARIPINTRFPIMARKASCLFALLGLACAPPKMLAQTSNGMCRAAVQHLTLPPTAESSQAHPGLPLSPIQFLYSSRGIDFYSVIFRFPNYLHVGGNSTPDISLLWVYQDEAARQQMIETLRHASIVIRQSDATPPSLENFKFAVMHCVDGGKGLLSKGRCSVNDVQYFKPQACIVIPQSKDDADLSMVAASGAHNYRDAINALNWLGGTNDLPQIGEKLLYFDLPKDVFLKLKQFAAQVGP